jgi:hypothetical protein
MRTRESSSSLRWVEIVDSLRELRAIDVGNESEGHVALAVIPERRPPPSVTERKGIYAGEAHRSLRCDYDSLRNWRILFFLRFKLRLYGTASFYNPYPTDSSHFSAVEAADDQTYVSRKNNESRQLRANRLQKGRQHEVPLMTAVREKQPGKAPLTDAAD